MLCSCVCSGLSCCYSCYCCVSVCLWIRKFSSYNVHMLTSSRSRLNTQKLHSKFWVRSCLTWKVGGRKQVELQHFRHVNWTHICTELTHVNVRLAVVVAIERWRMKSLYNRKNYTQIRQMSRATKIMNNFCISLVLWNNIY